jgi:hypothetical protein
MHVLEQLWGKFTMEMGNGETACLHLRDGLPTESDRL